MLLFVSAYVFFSALVIHIVQYIWGRRWLYYHAFKLEGPFAFPLIGSAHRFIFGGQEDFLDKIMKIVDKYHSGINTVSKLWMGNDLYIFVTKPKDVELFFNKCLEKAKLYQFGKEVLGDGLLLSPVHVWKEHRKIITMTFSPKILKSFIEIFDPYANAIVEKLDCGENYTDVFQLLFQTTLNMICETSLGIRVTDMSGTSQYTTWISRVQSLITYRFFKFWLHPVFIWKSTSLYKEFSTITANLWNYVGQIVETKRREKNTFITQNNDSPLERKIFLDVLLDITEKNMKWKKSDLMAETQTVIFGGSETTALLQSSVLVMLAMHQNIQDKVYQEIFEIFGDSKRSSTVEDLNRMEYLERVIKETVRVFPVVPLLARYVDRNVTLEKHVVPKDSTALIPILFIHRSPKYWQDPLKFDPDRFLPEETSKRHKYTYLPFSLGPRDCVGKRYAILSMKTVLSTIIRNFWIVSTQYKSVEDIQLEISVLCKAKNGYKVKIQRR